MVSKSSQSLSNFKADILTYELPSVLFASKDSSWVKSNVKFEIVDGSATIIGQTSVPADFSKLSFKIYDIVASLTAKKFDLAAKAYSLKVKTSLKAQTVDGEDYSQSKWSDCVHFAELKMTFDVSTNATSSVPVFDASSFKIEEETPETTSIETE